jgi:poly(A) polymerase
MVEGANIREFFGEAAEGEKIEETPKIEDPLPTKDDESESIIIEHLLDKEF